MYGLRVWFIWWSIFLTRHKTGLVPRQHINWASWQMPATPTSKASHLVSWVHRYPWLYGNCQNSLGLGRGMVHNLKTKKKKPNNPKLYNLCVTSQNWTVVFHMARINKVKQIILVNTFELQWFHLWVYEWYCLLKFCVRCCYINFLIKCVLQPEKLVSTQNLHKYWIKIYWNVGKNCFCWHVYCFWNSLF